MTTQDFQEINKTFDLILKVCKKALGLRHEFTVVKYGSVVNGLAITGGQYSDLDLTILVESALNEDLEVQITEEN